MTDMWQILSNEYPNFDWTTMEELPIIYESGRGTYRVNENRWPTSVYPVMPTPSEIASWFSS